MFRLKAEGTETPNYKVPRPIDFVDQLPRTPTGKLLKRLLRDPYWKEQDNA